MKITKRKVQIALGVLWLLDAALQFQYQMFTSSFANNVVGPAAQGQPLFVAGPIHFFVHIFLFHPAIFNSLAATTQLGLGVLILWKRTTKIGLIASMGWGLFVWYTGEGFGGIFGLHTIILMGAPGAALLYVILAYAVMPKAKGKHDINAQRPPYWLALVWAILWVGGAIYQLLPGQNTVTDVSSMIAGNGFRQPGWLSSFDVHIGNLINGLGAKSTSMASMHMTASQMAQMQTQPNTGFWFILLIVVIQAGIGLSVFGRHYIRNIGIGLGIVVSLIFWVVGQSFGGIFTGLATDPNSAVLFILLGLAILGSHNLDEEIKKFFGRLERLVT